jgi:hypothetical protein
MDWRTEYPSIAAVNEAAVETLMTWEDNLALPQTDVERTVRRRLRLRLDTLIDKELREKAPDVASAFDRIYTTLGISPGFRDQDSIDVAVADFAQRNGLKKKA